MGRRLTCYTLTTTAPPSVIDALGEPRYRRQVRVLVAAPSRAEARRLLDAVGQHCSDGDLRNYGGTLLPDHPAAALPLAEPGVVFVQPLDRREPILRYVEAAS